MCLALKWRHFATASHHFSIHCGFFFLYEINLEPKFNATDFRKLVNFLSFFFLFPEEEDNRKTRSECFRSEKKMAQLILNDSSKKYFCQSDRPLSEFQKCLCDSIKAWCQCGSVRFALRTFFASSLNFAEHIVIKHGHRETQTKITQS